ncbi:MAG: hypothetical protein A2035_01465 [Nitrospirae bacterium GWA2_42_11]|nr:MAG: hypothetical protein A2035_01465 [Nitrospirae bacterium GWA2_42_11]
MGRDNLLNIHSVIPLSRVNGPGKRLVVFFQGCARRCPGCFNPATHPFKPVHLYSPQGLYKEFLLPDIEGITVSGGEPFSQTGGLLQLLRLCKESLGLTTVVYTGFLYEELKKGYLSGSTLKYIDVLIDGRFEEDKKEPTLLARGSTNQRFFFFNSLYQQNDFIMPAKVEIIIGKDGIIKETGFSKTNFNLN